MVAGSENPGAPSREAGRGGATRGELDIKLTADNVPIVMHDPSLKRTMGVDRLVALTPRAELPKDVPTFEEAIACFTELGLGCNVEIKPCEGREAEPARAAVATLRRCWPGSLPPPLLSSFKEVSLVAARDAAPEFARAILIGELADNWRALAEALGAVGVNTNGKKLASARAREVKQAGFALSVYTINDATEARALVSMGVDCIITDRPDVIIAALN